MTPDQQAFIDILTRIQFIADRMRRAGLHAWADALEAAMRGGGA